MKVGRRISQLLAAGVACCLAVLLIGRTITNIVRHIWRRWVYSVRQHGGIAQASSRLDEILRREGAAGLHARLSVLYGVALAEEATSVRHRTAQLPERKIESVPLPSDAQTGDQETKFEDAYRELLEQARSGSVAGPNRVPRMAGNLDADRLAIKAVAFYLPQFHRIAENDEWWGAGFTEWTNVTKALPQFVGHYQPQLPGDLGFYDLRVPEVMREQVRLARQYGLYGFCFHYYWFSGRRLLERPLEQFLADRSLDIRFCLCWANENWTRRWDGSSGEVLLAQNYSPDDDLAFIDAVAPILRDDRYITVDGKPLLIVYRASLLPNAAKTAKRWRRRAAELGLPGLYLVAARSFDVADPRPFKFDASVDFPPHRFGASDITARCELLNPGYAGHVHSYEEIGDLYGLDVE